MKRRKKLKNRRWLRSRPKAKRPATPKHKSKHARRARAIPYMLAVKSLPCAAFIIEGHVCDGPIEADHAGNRFTAGDGTRADDATCIPLCRRAHQQRHAFNGAFAGWTGPQMREWLDGRIAQTQRYLSARGVAVPAAATCPPHVYAGADPQCSSCLNYDAARDSRIRPPLFADDIREDGNLDVRHPEAATEGNRR